MIEAFKSGKQLAYEEIRDYASSMVGTDPDMDNAWLDMLFYATTSISELENGLPEGMVA